MFTREPVENWKGIMVLQNRTKGTAEIVHDLRSPLTAIIGMSSTLLRTDATWNEEEKREFIEIIFNEANHLSEMIDGLLES